MKALDEFYMQQDEPVKGCLLALKDIILAQAPEITSEWKYGMPFFCYKGKMFCYLWFHKKYKQPYIGIVEGQRFDHADLLQEKRSRMKILLVDAEKDLPVALISGLMQQAINLYRTGMIKTGR